MKIAETRNRTVLPIVYTVCKKSSQHGTSSYFHLKDNWILFYILLGTAVIPGKKAAQNMQMLVYTNFIELSYDYHMVYLS